MRLACPGANVGMLPEPLYAGTQMTMHTLGRSWASVSAQVRADIDEIASCLLVEPNSHVHGLSSTSDISSSLTVSPRLARSRAGLRMDNSSSES